MAAAFARSQVPYLIVIHKSHGMGKHRHSGMDAGIHGLRTVTCRLHKCLIQVSCQPLGSHPCDWIPAVHAGMTGLLHLCITARAPAWERGPLKLCFPSHGKLELETQRFPSRNLGTGPAGWANGSIVCPRGTGLDGGHDKAMPTLLG